MKILRLRFTNLNSLVGESVVDFTVPPLSQSGLFAITGPTGAGKTTLLDAITLALYGRAARYGTTPNPEEVMSRHTGECSAQVEFSCPAGTFRSEWNLRRSRGKADGAFQNATRRIISLPGEEILSEKLRETEIKIEELTGLNYERFLRSVMLAQGDFAAFLKADKDRVALLEQITGTEIYSEISRASYEQTAAAKKICDHLTAQMGGSQIFTSEERDERTARLDEATAILTQHRKYLVILETRLTNARLFADCTKEAAAIEQEENQLAERKNLAQADLQILAEHEKTIPFIAPLTALDHLEKQQRDDQQKLTSLQTNLPELRSAFEKAQSEADNIAQLLTNAEQEEQTLKPLWAEVTRLDHEIAIVRNTIDGHTKNRLQDEKELQNLQTSLAEKNQSLEKLKSVLADIELWLASHENDAAIANILPDLQTTLSRWEDYQKIVENLSQEIADLTTAIDQHQKTLKNLTERESEKSSALEKHQQAAGQLHSDLTNLTEGKEISVWETERDQAQSRETKIQSLITLASGFSSQSQKQKDLADKRLIAIESQKVKHEKQERLNQSLISANELFDSRRKNYELLKQMQSLTEHRHDLQTDHPCPLCGSLAHPFAEQNPASDSELISARNALQKAESERDGLQKSLQTLEKEQAAESRDQAHIAEELADCQKALSALQKQWKPAIAELGLEVQPEENQILTTLATESGVHTATLQNRLKNIRDVDTNYRKQSFLVEEARALWQTASAEKERTNNQLAQKQEALGKAQTQGKSAQENAEQQRNQFVALGSAFGSTNHDIKTAQDSIDSLKKRSLLFTEKQKNRTDSVAETQALQAGIDECGRQLAKLSETITSLLAEEQTTSKKLLTLQGQRQEKFGDKVAAADQERLANALAQHRRALAAAHHTSQKAQHAFSQCESGLSETQQSIKELGDKLTTATSRLLQSIANAGFANLASLRAAILPDGLTQELRELRQALENATQNLAGRKAANQASQARLPAEAASDALVVEDLQRQRENRQNETNDLNQLLGQLRGELKQDDVLRENQRQLTAQIEITQAEYYRWLRLSNLIGSANGTVFSKFAQGLTLERLLALANRHLTQLNRRYSMRRLQKSEDLELEIIDHYQADAIRPMSSLSGGETFLASLALAVGLSELAGGRTSIESLFIDEGFGTLDADTLETAMSALDNLQASGKTIGVISHVEAMKERIPVQIRIQKKESGRSVLEIVS